MDDIRINDLTLRLRNYASSRKGELADLINEAADALESVQTKRGIWIDRGWHGDMYYEIDGRGNCWHEWECSRCHFVSKAVKGDYCPKCGARMYE